MGNPVRSGTSSAHSAFKLRFIYKPRPLSREVIEGDEGNDLVRTSPPSSPWRDSSVWNVAQTSQTKWPQKAQKTLKQNAWVIRQNQIVRSVICLCVLRALRVSTPVNLRTIPGRSVQSVVSARLLIFVPIRGFRGQLVRVDPNFSRLRVWPLSIP